MHIRKRSISIVTLALILVVHSGCASMNAPGEDKISITTIPPGAKVYDGSNLLGTTPLTYTFKRDTFQKKNLVIRMPGYKNQELQLGTVIEKEARWNFDFFTTTFGVTSWGIGALNGNMIKHYPDSYLIDLDKEAPAAPRNDQTRAERLRFVVINKDQLQKDIAAGTASICGRISRSGRERPPRERSIRRSGAGSPGTLRSCCPSATRRRSTPRWRSYEGPGLSRAWPDPVLRADRRYTDIDTYSCNGRDHVPAMTRAFLGVLLLILAGCGGGGGGGTGGGNSGVSGKFAQGRANASLIRSAC